MNNRIDALDELLAETGADGYLLEDDAHDADQRYLSGFDATDPYLTLYADGERHLLFWGTDYFTARDASAADVVHQASEYGYDGYGSLREQHRVTGAFVEETAGRAVVVPDRFPLGTARALSDRGIEVTVEPRPVVSTARSVKEPGEIEAIRATQRATEAAMGVAESLLSSAEVANDRLVLDGETVTATRLRREITTTLLDHDCYLPDPQIAVGQSAADPHGRSSGAIAAGEPVLIDLAPRDTTTGYFADMTRTFVRGEPADRLLEWFDLVQEALARAVAAIEPGVSGDEIDEVLCSFFEDRGFETPRTAETVESGVRHYMGHGVGLDVHELPLCTPDGGTLEAGNVLTIEPGLYDPAVGGIRLEDLLLVTENGVETLTSYPYQFRVT